MYFIYFIVELLSWFFFSDWLYRCYLCCVGTVLSIKSSILIVKGSRFPPMLRFECSVTTRFYSRPKRKQEGAPQAESNGSASLPLGV